VYYRGAESVGLDLREPGRGGRAALLAARADVLIESFRPGTMARYGLALGDLRAAHPGLVVCSLPGFPGGAEVGHDLNFTALTGLLRRSPTGIPALQIADVTSGCSRARRSSRRCCSAARTGEGCTLRTAAARRSPALRHLGVGRGRGRRRRHVGPACSAATIAAYRCYRCADGLELAVGCLEPKFWIAFATLVGRPELASTGSIPAPPASTAAAMQAWLAQQPRAHWLALVAGHALPVWPVHDLEAAAREPALTPLLEPTPLPGGATLPLPGPSVPSLGRTPHDGRAGPRRAHPGRPRRIRRPAGPHRPPRARLSANPAALALAPGAPARETPAPCDASGSRLCRR
jgi:alpha-methylacyl-CoA racemase